MNLFELGLEWKKQLYHQPLCSRTHLRAWAHCNSEFAVRSNIKRRRGASRKDSQSKYTRWWCIAAVATKISSFKAQLCVCWEPFKNGNRTATKMGMTGVFYTHHHEIIEKEDFSLMCRLFLSLVDIRHLEESTTAHQSSMRDGENLKTKSKIRRILMK